MSLAIVDTPQPFQPVLSDGLYFTLSSSTYDASTTFKFRYVYDLYVEGERVFQGKCSPNPFGLGIVDLQQILESYTNSIPVSYWNTTPIYAHETFPFSRPANEETIAYSIKCGYEYASSEIAGVTGFTGNFQIIGPPAVESETYKTFRSTMGTNPRATQQDFNISPFVLSGTPVGVFPTTSGLFLTNAPRIMDVSPEDYFVLGFTNYYMQSGTTPTLLSEPYYVQYEFFDEDGVLIGTEQYDNILSNGGGPRTSGCDVYPALYLLDPWTGTNFNTLYVGAGPANIPTLPANCAQYTVQLFGKFTGTTEPIQPTPSLTPSPTATPVISPSPTPSSTPPCTNCDRYTIEYTGLSSFGLVNYINCDTGALESFRALPTVIYVVCSCTTPTGDDLDIINIGSCVAVTPTPTPTNSGCNCIEYQLDSEVPYSTGVNWIDCEGNLQSTTLGAFNTLVICACEGTVLVEGGVYVEELGPCVLPTPTPTQTPTRTIPVTPTPTSTSGYAYYYLVRNCDDPGDQICLASNTFYPTGRIVKAQLIDGCFEILDFCSAPEDDVITLSYLSCEVCPR